MSKLNMKKVVVAIACLLLLIPATVAQSQLQAKAVCVDGELKGLIIRAYQPGTYTLMFSEGLCIVPTRRPEVTT